MKRNVRVCAREFQTDKQPDAATYVHVSGSQIGGSQLKEPTESRPSSFRLADLSAELRWPSPSCSCAFKGARVFTRADTRSRKKLNQTSAPQTSSEVPRLRLPPPHLSFCPSSPHPTFTNFPLFYFTLHPSWQNCDQ